MGIPILVRRHLYIETAPWFDTLLVHGLIVPLSNLLLTALLLSPGTNGYQWGQIYKLWLKIACEQLYTPRGVEMDIQMDYMDSKGLMTREGTCHSLQGEVQNLDVDSKQGLYTFTFFVVILNKSVVIYQWDSLSQTAWLCATRNVASCDYKQWFLQAHRIKSAITKFVKIIV